MEKQKLKEEVIAEWNIFLIEKHQSNDLKSILEWLLKKVLNVAEQFNKYGLFFLKSIEFAEWQQHGATKIFYAPKKECHSLNEQNKREIIKYYLSICSKQSVPTLFTIIGEGYVYDNDKCKIKKNNIIWLEAYFVMGECFIDIYTNSDAWLPNNKSGKEQKAIHNLNAPRLSNALKQVDKLKGIELSITDCYFTKYAFNKGFYLENF